MRLALNMATVASGGFLRAEVNESQQLIKKSRTEVPEEKKRGVVFPGHKKVISTMERRLAMVYKHHTAGCLPCPNDTAENLETRWRRKGTAAPPPDLAPRLPGWPSPPRTPPSPPGDTEGNKIYEIEGMPSRCVYMHSPLPNTQLFNHNAFFKDSKCDKDYIPDLLSTRFARWKYC